VSGFGLTALGAVATPPQATAASVVSGDAPSGVTASQFASMLVALLGGDTTADVMQPIARLDEDATGDATTRSESAPTEDAAGALHYGLLVDDLRPMSPSAMEPEAISPIALAPIDVMPLPMPLSGDVVAAAAAQALAASATVDPPARPAVERTVTVPSRNLDALAPEFRARLDRVITRMRNEFGHDVQLVETGRSPERQAWLFAQGRTRPGPVVTWTQQSAHLTGDAADVIVDGRWRDEQAYGRLHRIADEEGLRTLGARDPGHLELPAAVRELRVQLAGAATNAQPATDNTTALTIGSELAQQAIARATARTQRTSRTESTPSMRHDASMSHSDFANSGGSLAAPAEVASVATVAVPARVAQPGVTRTISNGERVESDLTLAEQTRSRRRTDRDAPEQGLALGTAPRGTPPSSTFAADAPAGRLVGTIDRVDHTTAIAGRSPREVAQLTLALDGGNGQRDDITIGVRSGAVGATIATSDGAMAERLRDNVLDLRKALESRGLGMDEFRAESRRVDVSDATHPIATNDRDALRVRAMNDAGASFLSRDGQDDSRHHGDERRAPRDPRQHGDAQQSQQDQRERHGAARDHAARLAAFRRSGRPIQGDHVA
jgi:hypothetical protein